MSVFIRVYWQFHRWKKRLGLNTNRTDPRQRSGCHHRVLAAGLVFISALFTLPCLEADSMSLARVADPVIIVGQELEPVLGSEI